MHVIIRADGNKEIAMGHVMRCLSIADALQKMGAEVTFLIAGSETKELIERRGFKNQILGGSYDCLEAELPGLEKYLKQNPAEWMLIDSYYVTEKYLRSLGKWVKTAYMDDFGEPVYPVSLLINYNIYGKELNYAENYKRAGIKCPEKMLLGCTYAPLREEFRKTAPSSFREYTSDVLITTGGGDLYHVAGQLCNRLFKEKEQGKHEGIRYHVICGPFYEQKDELKKLAEESADFIIHENVTNMSEIMSSCDVAVTAAGGTMYELCSMQLPAVCFYFAENQRRMAECFDRLTDIKNAGNFAADGEKVLAKLTGQLQILETDSALRKRIRQQMETLTDGKGVYRIAEAFLK